MVKIPTPDEELANSKVDRNARAVWAEALAQPEFAPVRVIWAYSASTSSDHRNGRCADFMVTFTGLSRAEQIQLGNRIRAYFVKHAARLHVQGIIWNGKVTGFPIGGGYSTPDVTYRGPAGTARTYSEADQHTDHDHVQVTGQSFVPLVPEKPIKWDGVSFPGAAAFHVGAVGPWVTYLGDRLVVHGFTGYVAGPGPVFTETDLAGVQWAQQQQGFSGDDADGIPGPTTWSWLVADPTIPPAPPEVPVTRFRFATFNVLSDASGKAGGEGSFASRLDRLVDTIQASKASILALQECNADRAAELQDKLGADWIWSRTDARAVMVRKSVWTMGTERVRNMPTPYSDTDKSWPLVELTHNESGEKIWAASVHFSSTSKYVKAKRATASQMTTERTRQAQSVVDDLEPYRLVIGGGDHNSSSLSAGKPKAVLAAAGFQLLTRDPDWSATVDSFPNSTPGAQWIDEIWTKPGLELTDGGIVVSRGGSDHNLMWAEVTIGKGSK